MINEPSPVRAVPHNNRLQATRMKPRAPEPGRWALMTLWTTAIIQAREK